MKKTIAYLIRHGELDNPKQVIYGRTIDLSLSEEGMRQIHTLADKIKDRNDFPISIYSSPLRRTIQTSEILSKKFNATPIVKDDDLIEVASSGVDGEPMTRLEELYKTDHVFLEENYGFENLSSVVERMRRALNNICTKKEGGIFFLVSHGDPLALLFWSLLHPGESITASAQWEEKYLDEYLEKGESWRLVFGDSGFEGYDYISRNDG